MAQVSPRLARRAAQACGAANAAEGDLIDHLIKRNLTTTAAVSTATDAEALAAALAMLAADPARRTAMGTAGRTRALDLYYETKVIARQIYLLGV